MRYCPSCGAEYRSGFDRCTDCDVALVDEPPTAAMTPQRVDLRDVYSTGRRVDAELIRSMLESHGLNARVWAGGMGPWRMESALTEVTGVPSAFNSYRVMVPEDEVEDAHVLLNDVEVTDLDDSSIVDDRTTLMQLFRARWVLVAAALFLLFLVLWFGPPE